MENYYRTLLYSLPEIVYQVDIDGKFVYVNDSISQLGYTPVDLLGKHFTEIISKEYHASLDRELFMFGKDPAVPITPAPSFFNERRTGGRITRNLKVRLQCGKSSRDEERLFIDGEVFATGLYETKEHGGNFVGTIGIIRELSGDAEQEKTIMRIERFYRLLIDNSLDVITILAHDGMVLFMSNSIERNLGMTPMNYIGENINEFTHPDDHSVIKSTFADSHVYSETAPRIEFRYSHADNSWHYFETSFIRIMDEDKRHVMCYILHSMDITRRRIAENSLANRERVYRQLLRTSPDAIALFDKEGDLILSNDKAAEITGMAREELIGINYLAFIQGNDKDGALRIRKLIHDKGIIQDFQFILIRQDGIRTPVEMSISAIKNDTGDLEGYITIFRDITQRKAAEEELLQLRSDLEKERNLLRERNDVIEKDLVMARKILMSLIPSSCFFPGIANYFRPMDIIGGDFYDYIQFRDKDKIGIFICDVSGHGLPSAFITSMIKTTIDQSGHVRENPAMLLSLLNDMLIPVSDEKFVTAFYAIYDGNTRTLTYARAGHNYPYRINGKSVTLIMPDIKCIPLGIFPNMYLKEINKEYNNEIEKLEPGEKILFYTDGLTETRNMGNKTESGVIRDHTDYESSGLIDAIMNNSHLAPQAFIDRIVSLLAEFRNSDSIEDDLCLICLEIK